MENCIPRLTRTCAGWQLTHLGPLGRSQTRMRRAGMGRKNVGCIGVSAILVPCSGRKSEATSPGLRMRRVGRVAVSTAANVWISRLDSVDRPSTRAADLYTGRGFKNAHALAQELGCRLFVVSAGLGLVASHTRIPSYDVSAKAIAPTVGAEDRQRIDRWWTQIRGGPFSSSMTEVTRGRGRILVALTKPYAAMVLPTLARLGVKTRGRLRLFGPSVPSLPTGLRSQFICYDGRLDVVHPGVGYDRAVRELKHFAALVAHLPLRAPEEDQAMVNASLAHLQAKKVERRPRLTDTALAKHIRRYISRGESMSSALKKLRRSEGLACQQERFQRVFRELTA